MVWVLFQLFQHQDLKTAAPFTFTVKEKKPDSGYVCIGLHHVARWIQHTFMNFKLENIQETEGSKQHGAPESIK